MNPFAQDPEKEKINKNLFRNAMGNNWEEVIKIYRQHPDTRGAKITRSGDTALHIAIAEGPESAVERLVSIVDTEALKITNEHGNTPLHLAAYLGNVAMCGCIASRDSKLMGIRNADNETPFFLAVLHGKKDAFLRLHKLCTEEDEGYAYCRGRDGDTILHSAVSGEYFDLAFQIIHLYEKLLNCVNEQGFSPLHILASKPSAFRSGSHLRGFDLLVYHCISVDELKEETSHTPAKYLEYDHENPKYPENYQTCMGMFLFLWKIVWELICKKNNDWRGDAEAQQSRDAEAQQSADKQVKCCKNNNDQGDAEAQQSACFSFPVDCCEKNNNRKGDAEARQSADKQARSKKYKAQGHEFFPKNYFTCFHFLKFIAKLMLVILGLGSTEVVKLREKKQKHIWSIQIMEELLEHASGYEYENNGRTPRLPDTRKDGETDDLSRQLLEAYKAPMDGGDHDDATQPDKSTQESQNKKAEGNDAIIEKVQKLLCKFLRVFGNGLVKDKKAMNALCSEGKESSALDMEKKETPILIAAKNGIKEMVAEILQRFPVAIHDMNNEEKNVVLLAVENRQPHVYKFLLERKTMKETIFRKIDKDGNSALHLAATLGDYRPWLIPGAALQMQWELKWYEFVKDSMPLHFFPRYNKKFQTSREIFSQTHHELAKEGGQWLTSTSESCSVVAALIATVAFATSATVPGGVKSESGTPTLQNEPAFAVFAISSLVALCFSVTSVVMFLAILTSRYEEKDFGKGLPRKLLMGLTSLFVSIGAMLISFCAGHFFVLREQLKYAAFPMYAITCLPVTFFAVAQFGLYFDLVKATIKKVPQRSSK